MNNIVTSLDVKQNSDSTAHVKYTVSFQGTNHICYGEFDTTTDEATNAFKDASTSDMWLGFETLILTRLKNEATSALASTTTQTTTQTTSN